MMKGLGSGVARLWWALVQQQLGGPQLLRPQGLKLEARSAESGNGPATGPGKRCRPKLPQPPRVLVFLCSEMTSPAIENPACTVQVCHFTRL